MVDEELTRRVQDLRVEGLSPKQIARVLRVPPARVAPLVRALAQQLAATDPEPAIVGCWVSAGWSAGLTVQEGDGWPDRPGYGMATSGLVGVVVAREGTRNRGVSVCGYLVDTYCLGVKDALGPRVMQPHELGRFVSSFFDPFEGEPVRAPIGLARELVWGAIEFARLLGFEPAGDFGPTIEHLGPFNGPSAIGFGRDGRPHYVQGPHDDAEAIMQTLNESVGEDNFHFIVQLPIEAVSSRATAAVR